MASSAQTRSIFIQFMLSRKSSLARWKAHAAARCARGTDFRAWLLSQESMDFPEEQSGQTDQFATVSQGGFIDTSTDVSRRQADPVAEAEAGGISHPPEPAAAVEAGAKAQTPTAENSPLRGFASLSDTAAPVIRHSNRDWVGAIHVGGDPYSWIGKKIEVLWAPNKKWYGAHARRIARPCTVSGTWSRTAPQFLCVGVIAAVPSPCLVCS